MGSSKHYRPSYKKYLFAVYRLSILDVSRKVGEFFSEEANHECAKNRIKKIIGLGNDEKKIEYVGF